MQTRRRFPCLLLFVLMAMLGAVAGSYLAFGLGQDTRNRHTADVPVAATALPPIGTPSAPYAAIDPALMNALLNDTPLTERPLTAAGVPPIGLYLPREPGEAVQLELPPPPTLPPPEESTLPDEGFGLPVDSSQAGLVELGEYAGEGCAPAGLPVNGVLTQRFHSYHSGIDLGVVPGTAVYATHSGEVMFAGWNIYGLGYVVMLQSGPFITYYAHLTNFNVNNGDEVAVGDVVGWSGSTGNSTGPHVHYETRVNDVPVDPLTFEQRGYGNC